MPSTEPARVFLLEDRDFVRAGLRAILDAEVDLTLAGEALAGRAGLDACIRVQPDLVIVDVHGSVQDGLDMTRALKTRSPGLAVVWLSELETSEVVLQALRAGADGYVTLDADRQDLLNAIRRALAGVPTLSDRLTTELLTRLASEPVAPAPPPLTRREQEVLVGLAEGQTNREIATQLRMAVGTAKTHVEHILFKLGAVDRTEAAVRRVELGLVVHQTADPLGPGTSRNGHPTNGRSLIEDGHPAQRRYRRSSGQAVVELAVVFPIIMSMALLALDVGRLFSDYISVANAAREGAAFGATHPTCWVASGANSCPDPGNIAYAVRQEMGSTPQSVTVTCPSGCAPDSTVAGHQVNVSVTRQFTLLFPLVSSTPWTIESNATAIIQ